MGGALRAAVRVLGVAPDGRSAKPCRSESAPTVIPASRRRRRYSILPWQGAGGASSTSRCCATWTAACSRTASPASAALTALRSTCSRSRARRGSCARRARRSGRRRRQRCWRRRSSRRWDHNLLSSLRRTIASHPVLGKDYPLDKEHLIGGTVEKSQAARWAACVVFRSSIAVTRGGGPVAEPCTHRCSQRWHRRPE